MTTRLAAARHLVEVAYEAPALTFPARPPMPDERPAVGRQIRELARTHGFITRENFTQGLGAPKWRVANSSAPESYYGIETEMYHLSAVLKSLPLTTNAENTAYVKTLPPETIVMFTLSYHDRKPYVGALVRRAGVPREVINVTELVAELKRLG